VTARARSFGAVAQEYDRLRPAPVPEALLELVPAPDSAVLDLAAGTGLLSRSLAAVGVTDVVAVEPDEAMRAVLGARSPGARVLPGTAEDIPLPDASVDAVLAASAWHWFDPEAATAEIARVLRPGGVLAALWNGDDATVEWVRGYHEAAGLIGLRVRDRAESGLHLPEHPAFEASEHSAYPNAVRTSVEGLLATLGTHSWALVAQPADRDAALARVRDYLATRPETSAGEFELPLFTDVVRMLRK
jgi:SAM-dependent methyltransferase